MYRTANWALGELLNIPGPTGCIVTYCSGLLNVFWHYAERFFFFFFFFFFFEIEVFSVWL